MKQTFEVMSDIQQLYRGLLLKCEAEQASYPERDLVPTSYSKGRYYQGDLLIVGRAINGGEYDFSKDDAEYFRGIENGPLPFWDEEALDWVDSHAGAADQYNTNKSAYWRVARKLAEQFIGKGPDSLHHIACSNLYKVAPEGGNPSSALAALQLEHCIEILKAEMDVLRPKNVVFLTGYDWIKDFLGALGYEKQLDVTGLTFLDEGWRANGRNFIASQHPQGKSEEPHVEEIIAGLRQLESRAQSIARAL